MRTTVRSLLALALAHLALAGCGGGSHYAGTYANLQIVAASPDAPPIDVILDGRPFVTGLDYGQGTGEQPILPGSHTLLVQIETPGTPTTVIGPTSLDTAADMDYVVAVEGSVGSLQAPGLSLVTFPHALSVVPAQSARIQVLNAYSAPVTVYLTAPGATGPGGPGTSSTPLGTAPPGGSVGPTEVPAGDWELWIETACGLPGIPPHSSVALEGGTDLVFVVVPPFFPPGEVLYQPCSLFLPFVSGVDAFGKNTWLEPGPSLRAINASPNSPALTVTANGNQTAPLVADLALAYGGSSGYFALGEPGTYALAITPARDPSEVLASQDVNVTAGTNYSLYALGPFAAVFPFITRDDYRAYSTQARLRFIQGSPSARLVDVYLTASGTQIASTSPTYAAVPFATDTGFVSYVEGSYDLAVTPAGDKSPIIGPLPVTLSNGGVYTAVARDAPAGGAPYGLIELDDPVGCESCPARNGARAVNP